MVIKDKDDLLMHQVAESLKAGFLYRNSCFDSPKAIRDLLRSIIIIRPEFPFLALKIFCIRRSLTPEIDPKPTYVLSNNQNENVQTAIKT